MKINIDINDNSVVFLENSMSALPIVLKLDTKYLFENMSGINQLSKKLSYLLPSIEEISIQAFSNKDSEEWKTIQNILYYFNIHELFKINYKSLGFTSYMLLRNKIIEIENNFTSHHNLDCFNSFTSIKAISELHDKANSHRINNHPLLVHMENHGLNEVSAKIFLDNYYVNNRVFHLFVAQQSLMAPMEMRVEMYKNLFDELGTGDRDMAHPLLFLRNFATIGFPENIKPFSETLHLFNSKYYATTLSENYHFGMGGLGFIEISMPKQMTMILNGFRKSPIPEKDLEFWRVHILIDKEHGKAWFEEMHELIHTPEQAEICLNGGLRLIEARAKMYDGIWNHLLSNNLV